MDLSWSSAKRYCFYCENLNTNSFKLQLIFVFSFTEKHIVIGGLTF